jgi:acetoacetyl-CoA synthetase
MANRAEHITWRDGELLWSPDAARRAASNLTAYQRWLKERHGLEFADYSALWNWSVGDIESFWQSLWDYFEVAASEPPRTVLESRRMPGASWFPGSRLNYAAHALRNAGCEGPALMYVSETHALKSLSWPDLTSQVQSLAVQLRNGGVRRGDRVVAYLPNIPQAVIALLATAAIGAVWVSCAPEFGARGVLDRVAQLGPRVLLYCDGYRYGGKYFDRRAEVRQIINGLDGLALLVHVPGNDPTPAADPAPTAHPAEAADAAAAPDPRVRSWHELVAGNGAAARDFQCEQVPFDHPLWILFSSGTTGLPKAIVHGHGGILLEMQKLLHLQMDVHPGDRVFFYTTTGWMMWNFLVSALLCRACPVLYDGHPAHPQKDVLWKWVEASASTLFGASPTYVELLRDAGIVPRDTYDLSRLRTIMPAGSPVTAAHTAWFYENVKSDLWVATGSGGTDCCTGFVGGVATLPVYAGEIQAPSLGVAACAFNERGESVVDEVGELVVTQPMPSMPLYFWNDPGDVRYRDAYFNVFPGIWRHGDFFRINARGGCFVLGRSDATLNRHGVRIGTAEIYRALATLEPVADALIVNLDLPGGKFFMPLFVKLAPGCVLDEALERSIALCLRREYTPRHVPDKIIAVPDIPMTRTGKKMEVPVRSILMGMPAERAANRDVMANPDALQYFVDYARTQRDYSLTPARSSDER